jgi:hypothetical protein
VEDERRRLEEALVEAELLVNTTKETADKYPHAPSAQERLRYARELLRRVQGELAKLNGGTG